MFRLTARKKDLPRGALIAEDPAPIGRRKPGAQGNLGTSAERSPKMITRLVQRYRLRTASLATYLSIAYFALLPSNLHAQWTPVSGCASWLTEGYEGPVFTVGCDSTSNKSLWRFTGTGTFPWAALPSNGVQITRFDESSMWLRRANGEIRKWNGTGWNAPLAFGSGNACASYIAAGPDGTVVTLGCEGSSNKSVWRFNGGSWQNLAGLATQVTVNTSGIVFVVDSQSRIFQLIGTSWGQLPGSTNRLTSGVIGDLGALGIGDNTIYWWNQKFWNAGMTSTPNAPTKLFTNDWAVNANGQLFRLLAGPS